MTTDPNMEGTGRLWLQMDAEYISTFCWYNSHDKESTCHTQNHGNTLSASTKCVLTVFERSTHNQEALW